MATLTGIRPREFIGLKVKSKAVGSRAEFEGTITGYCGEGYHVQDEDGNGWVRSRREFSIIADTTDVKEAAE